MSEDFGRLFDCRPCLFAAGRRSPVLLLTSLYTIFLLNFFLPSMVFFTLINAVLVIF